MIKIGITGGIGSGKSTICRLFALLGVPIFDADSQAKRLMNDDPQVHQSIVKLFGSAAYREGQLDRAWIASCVFQDAPLLDQLDRIIHPAVAHAFDTWAEQQHSHYVIEEAAILFESGADCNMDKTVTVSAPESLRIQRTCRRDHTDREAVLRRMAAQWSDAEREARADYVILSDETTPLIEQVLSLHKIFNQL